ncbi:MAG: hypothetical protein IPK29_18990 [Betaproteobacteria bacterium]|nr:hypothetical protein [Betaproteobacteria bacterium]
MNKRHFLTACLAVMVSTAAGANDPWPNKPIRLVVPFPAGGAADVQARLVAVRLSERLKQPVIVDNKAGAGGNIGALGVARAAADGYTFLLGTPGPMAINKHLYRDMQFDPETDFAPVSFVSRITNVLVVNAKLPIKDANEFLKYAREAKDPIPVGIPGKGSAAHLAVVSLEELSKLKFNQVFYKGQRAGDPGSDRRHHPVHDQRNAFGDAAREVRGAARARRHQRGEMVAQPDAADAGQRGAGLRVGGLVRHRRSQGHAGADRRDDARGGGQDPAGTRGGGALQRPGRRAGGRLAGRADPARIGQVEARDRQREDREPVAARLRASARPTPNSARPRRGWARSARRPARCRRAC